MLSLAIQVQKLYVNSFGLWGSFLNHSLQRMTSPSYHFSFHLILRVTNPTLIFVERREVELPPEADEEHEAVDKVESDPNPALAERYKGNSEKVKESYDIDDHHRRETCTSRRALSISFQTGRRGLQK